MTLESAVRLFACIHLFGIGFSHVFAHEAWTDFFIGLRERGKTGALIIGWISLGFGSVIAAFHPVWSGLPIALTLYGWSQVVKGAVYLCAPGFGLERLMAIRRDRSSVFRVPGFFLIALGGLMVVTLTL